MDSNDFFLTSNIFYRNNKLYYLNNKNKIIKIYNNNWQRYLEEYGWMDFKLNLDRENYNKINRFGILDCGGNGDCLFLCILESLKNNGFIDMDVDELRLRVSNQITKDNFDIILENYKAEKINGEFEGNWDPFTIKNINELKAEIQKSGENFMGDHILIQLLEKELNINIIILNATNYESRETNIISKGTEIDRSKDTIFLSYWFNCHFQLIGYFNDDIMKTKFNFDEIPTELF